MTLTEVVRLAGRDASFRELSRRAAVEGHLISHTTLADWAAGRIRRAPSRTQAEAIAVAVGKPYPVIVEALARQFYNGGTQ